MLRILIPAVPSVLVALLFTPPALAGPRPRAGYSVREGSASYEVAFDDEALLAPGSSAYGEWLKVRGPAPRAMLLRPRTSFVPELLTTVNGL